MKIRYYFFRVICSVSLLALFTNGHCAFGQTTGFVPYNPNQVQPTNSYGYQVPNASAPPQTLQQPVPVDPFAVQQPTGFVSSPAATSPPVYNVAQAPQQFGQPPQFTQPQAYPTQPTIQPVVQQPYTQPPLTPQGFSQQPVVQQPFPQQPYPGQPGQPFYTPQNYAAPYGQQPNVVLDSCNQFLNCEPQSTWTTQINWLYLTRTKSNSFPLLLDLPSGNTIVDAKDLDYGWKSGFDIAISRRLRNGSNFELRYFQVSDWTALFSSPFVENDAIATNPPSLLADPAPDPGIVDYVGRSALHSFEINLVDRSVNNESLQFSLGFRWMEVNENLAMDFSPVVPVEVFNINTNNHLYGLQLGANGVFYKGNRFNFVGWGKGGIFANVCDQTTTATLAGPVLVTNRAGSTVASFVGETGLLAEWKLFPRTSLIGGYQLLWVSGAALAPDQLPNMTSIAGGLVPTGVDQSTAYYHGLFAGIDVHW